MSHDFVPAALPTVEPLPLYLVYVRRASDLMMADDTRLEEHSDRPPLIETCFSREYLESAAQLVGKLTRDQRVTGW